MRESAGRECVTNSMPRMRNGGSVIVNPSTPAIRNAEGKRGRCVWSPQRGLEPEINVYRSTFQLKISPTFNRSLMREHASYQAFVSSLTVVAAQGLQVLIEFFPIVAMFPATCVSFATHSMPRWATGAQKRPCASCGLSLKNANAIVPAQAAQFIRAYAEAVGICDESALDLFAA